jgi:hypothetical protein
MDSNKLESTVPDNINLAYDFLKEETLSHIENTVSVQYTIMNGIQAPKFILIIIISLKLKSGLTLNLLKDQFVSLENYLRGDLIVRYCLSNYFYFGIDAFFNP